MASSSSIISSVLPATPVDLSCPSPSSASSLSVQNEVGKDDAAEPSPFEQETKQKSPFVDHVTSLTSILASALPATPADVSSSPSRSSPSSPSVQNAESKDDVVEPSPSEQETTQKSPIVDHVISLSSILISAPDLSSSPSSPSPPSPSVQNVEDCASEHETTSVLPATAPETSSFSSPSLPSTSIQNAGSKAQKEDQCLSAVSPTSVLDRDVLSMLDPFLDCGSRSLDDELPSKMAAPQEAESRKGEQSLLDHASWTESKGSVSEEQLPADQTSNQGRMPSKGEEVTHWNCQCAQCGTNPIVGPRSRCTVCSPVVDLCAVCDAMGSHPTAHLMFWFRVPVVPGPSQNARSRSRQFSLQTNRQDLIGQELVPKAEFFGDATLPDGSICTPGQVIQKQWALKNSGRSVWPERTRLVRVAGLVPRQVFEVQQAVPGEVVILTVEVVAPQEPQQCVGYFRLQAPDGRRFGPRVWFDFIVRPVLQN
eukprot:gb/GEZN01006627.1/.p1 GENE.gb/GEZN01006627.1/~~gb/GEZN01006627.1/.p1  ORF type:complete len:497 (+),score=34.21 gb/GEZN01006627.1/:46-1491(+)